jgi:hypothetical protein
MNYTCRFPLKLLSMIIEIDATIIIVRFVRRREEVRFW